MQELVNQLVQRVGLDQASAEKVAQFLKEHAGEIPQWLQGSDMAKGLLGKVGGLGGMLP